MKLLLTVAVATLAACTVAFAATCGTDFIEVDNVGCVLFADDESLSWDEARQFCEERNAELVIKYYLRSLLKSFKRF